MIEEILPADVVAGEAFGDPPDATLLPEEEVVVCRAVEKRRREFTTVRACARAALDTLGVPAGALLPGPRGAPSWPAGVVGSMTHCDGYRAAAVARADDVRAIGVDAEPHQPLPHGVRDAVTSPHERALLDLLAGEASRTCWDRLLFCAKEALYKVWSPLTGRWLEFTEATVTLRPSGTFTARLTVPGPVVDGQRRAVFPGRWLVRDGLIVAAVVIPAPQRRGAGSGEARRVVLPAVATPSDTRATPPRTARRHAT